MDGQATMHFKEHSNPLYDVVADEADWLNGLCAIFAHALEERFSMPLKALLVRSVAEPNNRTLVHAFGVLPDGRFVDSRGAMTEEAMRACYEDYSSKDWQQLHCAQPGEEVELVIEPVTVALLWSLSPEDLDATNAAHAHIEAHPERFQDCGIN